MTPKLSVQLLDRGNRLGDGFEESLQARKRAKKYRLEIRKERSGVSAAGVGGDFVIVSIGKQKNSVEKLQALRNSLDERTFEGLVAILSQDLANTSSVQQILFRPGRTDALRFIVENKTKVDPQPVVDNLLDLVASYWNTRESPKESVVNPTAEAKLFHKPYLEASRPIRNPKSQRLDAKRVAGFFDLSLRELSRILGKSHGTVDKTPDSKNLQLALRPFEEIMRGRLLVENNDDLFRQWLNTACDEFPEQDGRTPTPMDIIRMGQPEVVAGLVDQELTGEPS